MYWFHLEMCWRYIKKLLQLNNIQINNRIENGPREPLFTVGDFILFLFFVVGGDFKMTQLLWETV